MLEKLKYPDSVKIDWYYDLTAPEEAEKYLNRMASEGYVLHWITQTGKALFVRNGMPRRVYCVAATGSMKEEKKDALKERYAEAGWTWGMEFAGLQIFQADRESRPERPEAEPKMTRAQIEESLRDYFKLDGEIFTFILGLIAVGMIVLPAGKGGFWAELLENPMPLIIVLYGLGTIILKKLSVYLVIKNLEQRRMREADGTMTGVLTMTHRLLDPLRTVYMLLILAVCYYMIDLKTVLLLAGLYLAIEFCGRELVFVAGEKVSMALVGVIAAATLIAVLSL